MKLYAVVTLFNPPAAVINNLRSYVSDVDGLILWDNTPGGAQVDWPEDIRRKIVDHRTGANVGIGLALNHAIDVCQQADGVSHLLTMDQDSRFADGAFAAYRAAVETNAGAGAYVPHVNGPTDTPNLPPRRVEGFIVSGTIFPLSTFTTVGRFEERFVIDMIDVDYALRLCDAGLTILHFPSICLHHTLGQPLRGSFLGLHPVTLNYSPLRTYYITRNLLYLHRARPTYHRPDLLRTLVWKRPFYILFMEQHKWAKLVAWTRGVTQGLRRQLTPDLYVAKL